MSNGRQDSAAASADWSASTVRRRLVRHIEHRSSGRPCSAATCSLPACNERGPPAVDPRLACVIQAPQGLGPSDRTTDHSAADLLNIRTRSTHHRLRTTRSDWLLGIQDLHDNNYCPASAGFLGASGSADLRRIFCFEMQNVAAKFR